MDRRERSEEIYGPRAVLRIRAIDRRRVGPCAGNGAGVRNDEAAQIGCSPFRTKFLPFKIIALDAAGGGKASSEKTHIDQPKKTKKHALIRFYKSNQHILKHFPKNLK